MASSMSTSSPSAGAHLQDLTNEWDEDTIWEESHTSYQYDSWKEKYKHFNNCLEKLDQLINSEEWSALKEHKTRLFAFDVLHSFEIKPKRAAIVFFVFMFYEDNSVYRNILKEVQKAQEEIKPVPVDTILNMFYSC